MKGIGARKLLVRMPGCVFRARCLLVGHRTLSMNKEIPK